jgi:hypothetical protein
MHLQNNIFTYHGFHRKHQKLSFLLSTFCFLTILGFVIICYDDDLLDNYDPPVIALRCPIILYHATDEITLIKLIGESVSLPLINNFSFLTRAPPG